MFVFAFARKRPYFIRICIVWAIFVFVFANFYLFATVQPCLFVFVFVCFICFNLAIFFFLKQPIATLRLHGVCRGCKLQQDTNSKFVDDKTNLREAQLLKQLTTPQ